MEIRKPTYVLLPLFTVAVAFGDTRFPHGVNSEACLVILGRGRPVCLAGNRVLFDDAIVHV